MRGIQQDITIPISHNVLIPWCMYHYLLICVSTDSGRVGRYRLLGIGKQTSQYRYPCRAARHSPTVFRVCVFSHLPAWSDGTNLVFMRLKRISRRVDIYLFYCRQRFGSECSFAKRPISACNKKKNKLWRCWDTWCAANQLSLLPEDPGERKIVKWGLKPWHRWLVQRETYRSYACLRHHGYGV